MNWFYALNDQQHGPVDQAAFDQLAARGVISRATLVWREGMADWKPYGEVAVINPPPAPASGGGILCSECGLGFAPNEVIRLGKGYVCAGCKPIALQKMREGVADTEAEQIRKEHINHEASIKSVGFLYFLGAAVLLTGSVGMLMAVSARRGAFLEMRGVLFIGMGVWMAVAGVGLRRLAPWGRVLSIILSAIGLIGFPLGTVINGYILYLLLSKKGSMVFSEEYKRVIEQTPDVKYRTSIVIWVLLGLLLLILMAVILPLFLRSFSR